MPANNPAGADCCKILVVLQSLLAATQPERYVASYPGKVHLKIRISVFKGTSQMRRSSKTLDVARAVV
ncbi:MAG: hypothetical protein AAGF93_17295 [Cyanobacteria bacterium P01_H01_bin.105]